MSGISTTDFVPSEISNQIKDFSREALNTTEKDLQNKYLEGTEESLNQVPKTQAFNTQFSGIGNNDNLIKAIENRGLRSFGANQAELKSDLLLKSVESRLNRLTNSAKLVNAEYQQNQRAKLNKYIDKMNRKRARAGVLGNVLGIAGAAAGGFMTGSPAGAMAGYQMGQGIGNASSV